MFSSVLKIIPILRAGLALAEHASSILPATKTYHLGTFTYAKYESKDGAKCPPLPFLLRCHYSHDNNDKIPYNCPSRFGIKSSPCLQWAVGLPPIFWG